MLNVDPTIARAQSLIRTLESEYHDDPNVLTIGFGSAVRDGRIEDGISIVFRVRNKLPSVRAVNAVGSKPIPSSIEGFSTDIVEGQIRRSSNLVGQRDEKKYDPLLGGVATSNIEGHVVWFNAAGTLGVLATDNASGAPVALSNWHVWAENGETGDRIMQPGHPTGADHVQAVTKVLACGPLLTSVIEWEVPDPIASALYGGALAAATAAFLSDYRDPSRRGQDATPVSADEKTLSEQLGTEVDYFDLPIPGHPFRMETRWDYSRNTDSRALKHSVREQTVNAQFLLAKTVWTDKGQYQPGETITVSAAIWDYQQARSCSDYHVIAHLISQENSDNFIRVVLHPSRCEDKESVDRCYDFGILDQRAYPINGTFDWISYHQYGHTTALYTADYGEGAKGIFLAGGVAFQHEPASRVRLRVVPFGNTAILLTAYNNRQPIGQTASGTEQGVEYKLEIVADGITAVIIEDGGKDALLLEYCVEPVGSDGVFKHGMPKEYLDMILRDAKGADINIDVAKARRCCFSGTVRMPATTEPSKWNVHMTVQNINNVPDGTDPEIAATTIGGHLIGANAYPEGCAVVMLLDHAFEVI